MPNRLSGAPSEYLRAHADNPVDWWPWGAEAFAEAARRDVPVMVSIGYATCHWCHVMARESFADPVLAEFLNAHFVAVKVDREEHAEVDAAYLAAAAAFTPHLGWPLTVFVTPAGQPFYAGTYWPPEPRAGHPAFRTVLDAVLEAFTQRRDEVDDVAARLTAALAAGAPPSPGGAPDLAAAVDRLAALEDTRHGGFGGAPKFPVAPVLGFLASRAAAGDAAARDLAHRTLRAMAASDLRDADGGFFRYATRADWSEPHYERMLSDNAQLLAVAVQLGHDDVARAVARFLTTTLALPDGGFASAQDSESTIDGVRVEGEYYRRPLAERAQLAPPPLDRKLLTGLTGLAIGALAFAGRVLDDDSLTGAAIRAAEAVITRHLGPPLVRSSLDGVVSTAPATLEDVGLLAGGLAELAVTTGAVEWALLARDLVDATVGDREPFRLPGGGDAVLAAHGVVAPRAASDGALPSPLAAIAGAAMRIHELSGDEALRAAAQRGIALVAADAVLEPVGYGAALAVLQALADPRRQLVVVAHDADDPLVAVARAWTGGLVAVVTPDQCRQWADAGFALFDGRVAIEGRATAYLCEHFVCRLPITDPDHLRAALAEPREPGEGGATR